MKGQPVPKPGIPESFRVLIKELQSLGLDVHVQDSNGDEVVEAELSTTRRLASTPATCPWARTFWWRTN